MGSKSSWFSLYRQRFLRYGPIFKIGIFGYESWPLAKVPKVAYILSFYPRGSKFSLFSLYGQWFPRYRPIFILPIWAWHFAISHSSISCTCTLFLPQWVKIGLIFALRAAVSKIWTDFQNCHIWSWNLAISQSARSCMYILSLSTPWGRNRADFHSTGSGFWDTGLFSKLAYLGMNLGHWPKCQKLHIYFLSTPGGQNSAYFRSTGSGFQDTDPFSSCLFGHDTLPSAIVP